MKVEVVALLSLLLFAIGHHGPLPASAKVVNGTSKSSTITLKSEPAEPCNESKCHLPTCRCASESIPGGLSVKDTPQIVMFSFDDGLRDQDYQTYYSKVFNGRKNPNGCPVGITYFVSHFYSDYTLVEHAYLVDAAEIADHSVTHRTPSTWWENASEEEWTRETNDQRSILNKWGNIPMDGIRGFRSPFLATSETELKVLHQSGFHYEASMVTDTNYWPFTLDYKSPICNSPATCPSNAYPGLWLVPNVVYKQSNDVSCAMLDACTAATTEEEWMEFFEDNFNAHYQKNRSPFGIYTHSAWFYLGETRASAMMKFLDKLSSMDDVYIVTHSQMLEWVQKPTTLEKIHDFEAWKCPSRPNPRCEMSSPACDKTYPDGILKTCTAPCPPKYPAYGNPEGK